MTENHNVKEDKRFPQCEGGEGADFNGSEETSVDGSNQGKSTISPKSESLNGLGDSVKNDLGTKCARGERKDILMPKSSGSSNRNSEVIRSNNYGVKSSPRLRAKRSISIEQLVHEENVEVAPEWVGKVMGAKSAITETTASKGQQRAKQLPDWKPKWSREESMTKPSRSIDEESERICSHCGTRNTPSWRRNHLGALLCNACGLYERIHRVPRTFVMHDGAVVTTRRRQKGRGQSRKCANCLTESTPMWRRIDRIYYCNACAIFYRTNGFHRANAQNGVQHRENGLQQTRQAEGEASMSSLLDNDAHSNALNPDMEDKCD